MKKVTLNPQFEAKLLSYPLAIRSGAGDAKYYELISDEIFIHFCKLMAMYRAHEKGKWYDKLMPDGSDSPPLSELGASLKFTMNKDAAEPTGKFGRMGRQSKPFTYEHTKKINAGIEGIKTIAKISTPRGELGDYVLKISNSQEEAPQQELKYQALKARGVHLPGTFKAVQKPDGGTFLVISDLTEGSKNLVVSQNNREVLDPSYQGLIEKIPPDSKQRIMQDLISDCFFATNENPTISDIYRFDTKAFMLIIDPEHPETARAVVGDIGAEVTKTDPSKKEEVTKANLFAAGSFYAYMLDGTLQLPADSPYAILNGDLVRNAEEEKLSRREIGEEFAERKKRIAERKMQK